MDFTYTMTLDGGDPITLTEKQSRKVFGDSVVEKMQKNLSGISTKEAEFYAQVELGRMLKISRKD